MPPSRADRWGSLAIQALLLVAAAACFAGAAIGRSWVDAHFLPDFTVSPGGRAARELFARAGLILVGLSMLRAFLAGGRLSAPAFLGAAGRLAVAVALALISGELVLRTFFWRPFDPLCCGREPLLQYDATLGWRPVPSRTGEIVVGGRSVTYTFDDHGLRVRDGHSPLDVNRPSLVLAGESFMMGYKVPWDDSIAGQLQQMTGLQAVVLAVDGYSNAQAYMRLQAELPRFRQPVAIVFLILPSAFRKDLDRTRPRLDANLQVLKPQFQPRLETLAHWLVPYESIGDIDESMRAVQAIQRGVVALSHERGAVSVTLVPDVANKRPGELALRRRLLDDAHLPYVSVPLQADWHVAGDEHPDARGDRALADAVVAFLRVHCAECFPPGKS